MHKLFYVVVFAGIFSCSNKHSVQVEQLSHAKRQIDSITKITKEIDLYEMKMLKSSIDENIDFVNKYDSLFTMDSAFVKHYGIYCGVGRTLGRLMRHDIASFKSNLQYAKNQLNDLKRDLKHDLIPEDSIAIYVQLELQAVNKLTTEIANVHNVMKMQYEAYNLTEDTISSYFNYIKYENSLE